MTPWRFGTPAKGLLRWKYGDRLLKQAFFHGVPIGMIEASRNGVNDWDIAFRFVDGRLRQVARHQPYGNATSLVIAFLERRT